MGSFAPRAVLVVEVNINDTALAFEALQALLALIEGAGLAVGPQRLATIVATEKAW
jgi:hypothetical protein